MHWQSADLLCVEDGVAAKDSATRWRLLCIPLVCADAVAVEDDVLAAFAPPDCAAECKRLLEGEPVARAIAVCLRRCPEHNCIDASVRDAVRAEWQAERGSAVPGRNPRARSVAQHLDDLRRDAFANPRSARCVVGVTRGGF